MDVIRRRFFGSDFNQREDIISIGDLKPMIRNEIKRLLEEEIEERIKQHLSKYLKRESDDEDFRWEYNSYTVLSNRGINNSN